MGPSGVPSGSAHHHGGTATQRSTPSAYRLDINAGSGSAGFVDTARCAQGDRRPADDATGQVYAIPIPRGLASSSRMSRATRCPSALSAAGSGTEPDTTVPSPGAVTIERAVERAEAVSHVLQPCAPVRLGRIEARAVVGHAEGQLVCVLANGDGDLYR